MLTNREKFTAQAQKYIERGQYDKAIREYLKIVAEDEKDVRTWLKIGDLYAKMGQKNEAAQTYQKVAQFYSDQGFYLKAVAVYKQILKIDPRLVEVNVALAELYRLLGLAQDTINQYEIVASFLQREGRTREAISAHQAILELDPANVAQRIKLAELYSKEEMVQDAAREFSQTADQLRSMGRLDDFLKVGERLLFHDPENRMIAKELAALYIQRGDARRALTKLQVSFKADPKDIETLDLLAQAFLALGQNHKSISVLKELARVVSDNGQPEQAIAAYERIVAIDPHDEEARGALEKRHGESYRSGGAAAGVSTFSQSRQTIQGPASGRQAVQKDLHRDEEVARIVTEADVYAKYGLYQKAIEHIRSALVRQPNLREIRERLYELCEAAGQPEEAVTELWALLDRAMTPEEAARYLGEILRIQPENKTALLRWRRIRAQSATSGGPGTSAAPPSAANHQQAPPTALTQRALVQEGGATAGWGSIAQSEAATGSDSLRDDLDEVDFFLRQNMRNEARTLLDGLLVRYPGNELITGKLAEVAAATQADRSGVFQEADVFGPEPHTDAGIPGPVYEMTRQGLRKKGSTREDYASYFDLAVAYRDMGLYPDAITEFRKAMQDRRRELQCRTLIGLCFAEQSMHMDAITEFKQALYVQGVREKELVEVYYHLGRLYEVVSDRKESLFFYEKVLGQDGSYKDTKERVEKLRGDRAGSGKG